MKYIKLFESFGSRDFKSDIDHIKMIMSDIEDDGIDFRVIPNERAFDDEKDYIYIKIYNIPFYLPNKLDYFDRKYKQLIGEIGDLYHLDKIRAKSSLGLIRSFNSHDEYYKWCRGKKQSISELDFEFSSHDGKEVF
jgi:hypothetical protein